MLKSLFALVGTLLIAGSVQATSLDPCAPTVKAQDSLTYCRDAEKFVSIRVSTLMSDPRSCSYSDAVEYRTANVKVTDGHGHVFTEFELQDGEFEFIYSPNGLEFRYGDVHLKDCAFPMDGGVSFGN